MRLLILSFYYEPDLSAGSFRTTALVRALRELAGDKLQIDVLTTLPNRYHTFTVEAAPHQTEPQLQITRIALPPHRSDIRGQARAFMRFAREALKHTAHGCYDVVFATSARLMTAALGAWVARRSGAVLYLDIRDILVDTIGDLLPKAARWPAMRSFSLIEAWTMRGADRINLVSPGFFAYFAERYGDARLVCFTNGIDDEFLPECLPPMARVSKNSPLTVLYAGNIGDGQGLHEILPGLASALRGRARFVVVGDGGKRRALEAAVAALDNVELRPPVARTDLVGAYRAADVLFLHLGNYRAFEKVLPSKLFEYAALGKPVLAGVGGYAARFVRDEISNASVFSPCDVQGAVAAFESLQQVDRARPDFVVKYARRNIMRSMAQDVLALAGRGT